MTLTVVDGGSDGWGEVHPNGGYWEPDGFTFKSCYRCGINMRLEEERERELRTFCVDCDYPTFRAPFEAGRAVDYLSVAA